MVCPTSPQLGAKPSQTSRRKAPRLKATGKPLVPRPQVTAIQELDSPVELVPQATRTKSGTHRQPRGALSLSSLLSSVAVKRHRGCDCHLYRQSVRLPKANQSSWLCVFTRQHLSPPALLVPTPDSRAGWGQSRTTETVETAGARGKRPQKKGCVSPVLCEGPRHVETFKATSEQQRTSWLFKEEGLGWGRQARRAHPASPQPAVPAAWGWWGGS